MRLSKNKELALIASGRIKLPAEKEIMATNMHDALIEGLTNIGCEFVESPAPQRKPAHTPGKMNKTEMKWAGRLELEQKLNCIKGYKFESVKLRLAAATFYTPDFLVIENDNSLTFHEVKGPFIREDAWVKFKMARQVYPEFRFKLFQLIDNYWSEK